MIFSSNFKLFKNAFGHINSGIQIKVFIVNQENKGRDYVIFKTKFSINRVLGVPKEKPILQKDFESLLDIY